MIIKVNEKVTIELDDFTNNLYPFYQAYSKLDIKDYTSVNKDIRKLDNDWEKVLAIMVVNYPLMGKTIKAYKKNWLFNNIDFLTTHLYQRLRYLKDNLKASTWLTNTIRWTDKPRLLDDEDPISYGTGQYLKQKGLNYKQDLGAQMEELYSKRYDIIASNKDFLTEYRKSPNFAEGIRNIREWIKQDAETKKKNEFLPKIELELESLSSEIAKLETKELKLQMKMGSYVFFDTPALEKALKDAKKIWQQYVQRGMNDMLITMLTHLNDDLARLGEFVSFDKLPKTIDNLKTAFDCSKDFDTIENLLKEKKKRLSSLTKRKAKHQKYSTNKKTLKLKNKVDSLSRMTSVYTEELSELFKIENEIDLINNYSTSLLKRSYETYDIVDDSLENNIINAVNMDMLVSVLNVLTPKECMIIYYRFVEQKTLNEVGEIYHLSREGIRRIEAKALRKLRSSSRIKKLKSGFKFQ